MKQLSTFERYEKWEVDRNFWVRCKLDFGRF